MITMWLIAFRSQVGSIMLNFQNLKILKPTTD